MPRKGFSDEIKAKALRLLSEGQSQEQIAKKIGCSVFSLQEWKKKAKTAADLPEEKTEPLASNEKGYRKFVPMPELAPAKETVRMLERRFWSKNSRGIDLFLEPRAFDVEEVAKLVQEAIHDALAYALTQYKK